jgi:hypothetical protein
VRGEITERAHSLRDPAVLEDEEDGRVYLFYCGAGEHCIGVAELLCLPLRRKAEGRGSKGWVRD